MANSLQDSLLQFQVLKNTTQSSGKRKLPDESNAPFPKLRGPISNAPSPAPSSATNAAGGSASKLAAAREEVRLANKQRVVAAIRRQGSAQAKAKAKPKPKAKPNPKAKPKPRATRVVVTRKLDVELDESDRAECEEDFAEDAADADGGRSSGGGGGGDHEPHEQAARSSPSSPSRLAIRDEEYRQIEARAARRIKVLMGRASLAEERAWRREMHGHDKFDGVDTAVAPANRRFDTRVGEKAAVQDADATDDGAAAADDDDEVAVAPGGSAVWRVLKLVASIALLLGVLLFLSVGQTQPLGITPGGGSDVGGTDGTAGAEL